MKTEQLNAIKEEALEAAYLAALAHMNTHYEGQDGGTCGFASLSIYEFEGKKIKGNTKLGRAMKAAGIRQDWTRTFEIWNPCGLPVQSVDIKEVGAEAAAQVFRSYGFTAYASSRMD